MEERRRQLDRRGGGPRLIERGPRVAELSTLERLAGGRDEPLCRRGATNLLDGPHAPPPSLAVGPSREDLPAARFGLVEAPFAEKARELRFPRLALRSAPRGEALDEAGELVVRGIPRAHLAHVRGGGGKIAGLERAPDQGDEDLRHPRAVGRLEQAERPSAVRGPRRGQREELAHLGAAPHRRGQAILERQRFLIGGQVVHEEREQRHGDLGVGVGLSQRLDKEGARELVVVRVDGLLPGAQERGHAEKLAGLAGRPRLLTLRAAWRHERRRVRLAGGLQIELELDPGARVLVELVHEGVTRAGVERPMAKADHAGLVRIGRDPKIVGKAPDEEALQAALLGVPPSDLPGGEVAAGGIDGANELDQLARRKKADAAGDHVFRVETETETGALLGRLPVHAVLHAGEVGSRRSGSRTSPDRLGLVKVFPVLGVQE